LNLTFLAFLSLFKDPPTIIAKINDFGTKIRQKPNLCNFFFLVCEKQARFFLNWKILETPILSPKQPKTMYNPPLDSQMLFAAVRGRFRDQSWRDQKLVISANISFYHNRSFLPLLLRSECISRTCLLRILVTVTKFGHGNSFGHENALTPFAAAKSLEKIK